MTDPAIPSEAIEAGAKAYVEFYKGRNDAWESASHSTRNRARVLASEVLIAAAPLLAGDRAAEFERLTTQLAELHRALTRVMPAARTAEEVQADAGAIRFGWGARFAALLEDLLDEDDLMAVLAAWETLLREQVAARAALEAATCPRGAQT